MRLNKKNFFVKGTSRSEPKNIRNMAFEKMQVWVEENRNNINIRIINIEYKRWSNGEEYILYYEDISENFRIDKEKYKEI